MENLTNGKKIGLLQGAIVLFSGGQDSTTALYWAKQYYEPILALFVNYGQRHGVERQQSALIAKIAGVDWEELQIDYFQKLGGNALVNSNIEIKQETEKGIPNTFVPGRNLLFLNYAAIYAYHLGINNIITGFCQADYSGYPDCRQQFVEAAEKALSLGMDYPFRIITPIMNLTKAQTWLLARELGCLEVIIKHSHTCYEGRRQEFAWGAGCGNCPACLLRKKGFEEAILINKDFQQDCNALRAKEL
ncbi:MAG: 7-cyano-7-deazaguanine synthase QueC [Bacteroidia bacterium]|nr:7-cyano-7-deazaguanine synthase QueC [Bacteroidia bacterium]MDW8158613.1 7-cyano-7-deazaguanine synthase QueC [Bacteroidia bacterium]